MSSYHNKLRLRNEYPLETEQYTKILAYDAFKYTFLIISLSYELDNVNP